MNNIGFVTESDLPLSTLRHNLINNIDQLGKSIRIPQDYKGTINLFNTLNSAINVINLSVDLIEERIEKTIEVIEVNNFIYPSLSHVRFYLNPRLKIEIDEMNRLKTESILQMISRSSFGLNPFNVTKNYRRNLTTVCDYTRTLMRQLVNEIINRNFRFNRQQQSSELESKLQKEQYQEQIEKARNQTYRHRLSETWDLLNNQETLPSQLNTTGLTWLMKTDLEYIRKELEGLTDIDTEYRVAALNNRFQCIVKLPDTDKEYFEKYKPYFSTLNSIIELQLQESQLLLKSIDNIDRVIDQSFNVNRLYLKVVYDYLDSVGEDQEILDLVKTTIHNLGEYDV